MIWIKKIIRTLVFEPPIIIRYLESGGAAAAVNLSILYVATDIFKIWYLVSSIIAFSAALVVSFLAQKYWTFKDQISDRPTVTYQGALFLTLSIINVGLNTLFMFLLVDFFGIWYFLAQILSAGIIAVSSFVVYRLLIFRRQQFSVSTGSVERTTFPS